MYTSMITTRPPAIPPTRGLSSSSPEEEEPVEGGGLEGVEGRKEEEEEPVETGVDKGVILMNISTLLKMGSYSSITMCRYCDNHLIYWEYTDYFTNMSQ